MRTLQQSLERGMTVPEYIFYGSETYLMEQMLQRLTALVAPGDDPWNREVLRGDEHDIAEIIESAQSPGFFGGRKLLIVRDAPWFKPRPRRKKDEADDAPGEEESGDKKQLDRLLRYLCDPNPDTVLVMTVDGSINRSTRLVKAVQEHGRLVEFSPLKGEEREQWLADRFRRAGKKVEPGLCSFLSMICAEGLGALSMEADKLLLYCSEQSVIRIADAEQIVSRSALSVVFELTDLVAERRAAQAVEVLRRLLLQGEAPQALTGMLAHQYRSALAVKDMLDHGFRINETASKLGINPYFAQKCAALARRLRPQQLLRALDILLAADLDGKSGRADASQALELAILKICAL